MPLIWMVASTSVCRCCDVCSLTSNKCGISSWIVSLILLLSLVGQTHKGLVLRKSQGVELASQRGSVCWVASDARHRTVLRKSLIYLIFHQSLLWIWTNQIQTQGYKFEFILRLERLTSSFWDFWLFLRRDFPYKVSPHRFRCGQLGLFSLRIDRSRVEPTSSKKCSPYPFSSFPLLSIYIFRF